jgi:uncharacterized membrane protein (UPF0127 family)
MFAHRLIIFRVDLIKIFISILLLFVASFANAEQACEKDNDALQAMPIALLTIALVNGEQKEFPVKLADNPITRAAGFQRVCASTIAEQPILFVFKDETHASFHMRNVVAPIDIAFIDKLGQIDSIITMQPYVLGSKVNPTYQSEHEVTAALETHTGFFTENLIDRSATLSWRMPDQ